MGVRGSPLKLTVKSTTTSNANNRSFFIYGQLEVSCLPIYSSTQSGYGGQSLFRLILNLLLSVKSSSKLQMLLDIKLLNILDRKPKKVNCLKFHISDGISPSN